MVIRCQNTKVSFIAHLFVRRKHSMRVVVSPSPDPSPPPPPPPKDIIILEPRTDVMKPLPIPQLDHLADISVCSASDYLRHTTPPTPPQAPTRPALRGRVDLSPRLRLTPEERLKRRLSTQRRREREEQDAAREEHERQARIRREKEESEQKAREDEERRKALLQDQIQQAAERRTREERDTRAAEECRLRAIRERKQLEHERRVLFTREMQKWRSEHIRRAESQSSEKEQERRRSAAERRSRIASMSDTVLQDDDAFNGWVTIQSPDNLMWKRRYFMFDLDRAQLSLCKNQLDSARSVDLLQLDGRIESFHEWYEGFEELEAIPHSFAVKFVGGSAWLMFADTEQDKDRLLLLLSEAAGVIV